jgi:DNA polymerase-3 subunit epsilon
MDLQQPWLDYTYVAFDTETSGAYPLGADIVEFGAIKWHRGEIIDRYQTLLKPQEPMSDFIIGIHGITNEMVADAPLMKDKVQEIRNFFSGSVAVAHHAPFDLGFLTAEFEKYRVPLPTEPVLCTSLLSRVLIPESVNHKLQTLVKFLNLPAGQAHRAFADAEACLQVLLECMKRKGEEASLAAVSKTMGKKLEWSYYSLQAHGKGSTAAALDKVVQALHERKDLDIVYAGGSLRGSTRRITPLGIVRNPDGDYVMALCHIDRAQKRFYLKKMEDIDLTARL